MLCGNPSVSAASAANHHPGIVQPNDRIEWRALRKRHDLGSRNGTGVEQSIGTTATMLPRRHWKGAVGGNDQIDAEFIGRGDEVRTAIRVGRSTRATVGMIRSYGYVGRHR